MKMAKLELVDKPVPVQNTNASWREPSSVQDTSLYFPLSGKYSDKSITGYVLSGVAIPGYV
jgi:hypothetical protein